jgi:hypothetical protein
MKLKLTQAGFETYTGQMGVVMFENGLSVGDVLPIDAIRISAAIGATWEDGSAANVGEMYLNNMHAPAHVGGDINEMSMPVEEAVKQDASAPEGTEVVTEPTVYTEDSLAEVADKEGIAGLRTIADGLSVKGTSIVGLIAGILKAQAAKTGE